MGGGFLGRGGDGWGRMTFYGMGVLQSEGSNRDLISWGTGSKKSFSFLQREGGGGGEGNQDG